MSTPSPNLFVIGAPKAGTTSVCDWLAQHPDVFWSVPKEPFHLAADFPGQRAHFGFTERSDYLALYEGEESRRARYRGDGSTTYLYSDVAVPEALRLSPGARFVVCVRDPVELVPSYHRTQVVALNEDRDLTAAWHGSLEGEQPSGVRPLDPAQVDYPRIGRQGAALRAVLDAAPPERVHVIVFDDLRDEREATWSALCRFLDLEPDAGVEFTVRNASTKAARFPRVRQVLHRPPAPLRSLVTQLRQWSRTTQLPLVSRVKGSLWATAPPPVVPDELRRELRDYFAADVRLLSSLMHRDLSRWTGSVVG